MKPLSKKEVEVIANLEFGSSYYFAREDIEKFFANTRQMTNTLYRLKKKKRIVPLSKKKYFLVPIKARHGKWTDNPLIVADEMFNGENYFVGGWYASWYWKLTDQVPMQIDIYTTQRQGEAKILNKRYVFHRTTKNRMCRAVTETIRGHSFRILSKEDTEKWLRSRK
jgi:predicted transcriptional regulator of viral defense system